MEIQPAVRGPTEMKRVKHVKYILPTDKYINKLPDYSGFGRKTTLRLNPDQIPDLHLEYSPIHTILLTLDKQIQEIQVYLFTI